MVKTPAKRTSATKPKPPAPSMRPPPASATPVKAAAKGKGKDKDKTPEERVRAMIDASNAGSGGRSHTVMLSDDEAVLWSAPRYYISTRSLALDKIIGAPGIPSGRFTEIYGPNSVGKTTILLHLIADCQAKGGVAVLIESEHALDLRRAADFGVDVKKIIHCQCSTIEDVFHHVTHFSVELRKIYGDKVPILIGWDSIAGTPTMAEMEAKVGQDFRAVAARIIKGQFRRATQIVAQQQTCFVATNQVYKTMSGSGYSEGHDTYGGDGPKYHASIRLDLFPLQFIYPRGTSKEDKGIPPVGRVVSVRVAKNKIAAPHRQRKIAIMYDATGIDNAWSIWNDFAGETALPCENPAIEVNGSWYSLADDLGEDAPSWQGNFWGLRDLIGGGARPELWNKLVDRYNKLP